MKVRVVGTGSIGTRYLRILTAMHERGELEDRPRAVPVGGVLREDDLRERVIVEDIDAPSRLSVDLTIIATQTARHVSDTQAFANSTARLLIEKPVATSTTQAATLATTARGVPTAVCAPLRFLRGFAMTKEALTTIGEVTQVQVWCRSWLPDWRPGSDHRRSYAADPAQGGVLRDLVHDIDIALALFGMPVTVTATCSVDPVLDIPVETTADMQWTYEGFTLHMLLDYVSPVPTRGLRVTGSAGTVDWDILAGTVRSSVGGTAQDPATFPGDLDRDAILMTQVLAAAAEAGTPASYACARLADGMRALAITEFAKTSSASGSRPVAVTIAKDRR